MKLRIARKLNIQLKSDWLEFFFWLGISILFVILVGGLEVLYKGNQNTKFLFALAQSGYGYLPGDWLANTIDPLPVFSFLVKFTYQYLDESFFYFYQIILIGIYLFSIVGIADKLYNLRRNKILFLIFLSIYLLCYSIYWPGTIPFTLFYGVAGQDFGFNLFLPNAFLAFLFLSILLFLNKKVYWALASIMFACYFHSGYLIGGAALVTAYLLIEFLEGKDFKRVVMLAVVSLILVFPVVLYSIFLNQTSTAEQVSKATSILVNLNIPQHTLVSVWWNESAFYKFLIMLIAILVARRTKLFFILLVAFFLIFFPAIALVIHPSNIIAFLQLWRVSTFEVPLASTILLASAVNSFYEREEQIISRWRVFVGLIFSILMIMATVHGVKSQIEKIEREYKQSELILMDFVKKNAELGQHYLIPPRASLLYSFRLYTGVPIFIDWKSHPYNAAEILEWYRRNKIADKFYLAEGQEQCKLLAGFVDEFDITNVVLPANQDLSCVNVEKIYLDSEYSIFAILP